MQNTHQRVGILSLPIGYNDSEIITLQSSPNSALVALGDCLTYMEDALEAEGIYPFATAVPTQAEILAAASTRLVRLASYSKRMRDTEGFNDAVAFYLRLASQIMLAVPYRDPAINAFDSRQMSLFRDPECCKAA
jgi:hypothetical protein